MVRLCERMHTLPDPGGLFDQDSLVVYLFEAVMGADDERSANESKRLEREHSQQAAKARRR